VGRFLKDTLQQLLRFHATIISVAYLALIVVGVFSHDQLAVAGLRPHHLALIGLLLLLLIWRIARLALTAPDAEDSVDRIELAFMALVTMLILIQATGGITSPFFPLLYLAAAVLVYFLGYASSILISLAGLAALSVHAMKIGSLEDIWQVLLADLGFTLVFIFTVGLFIKVPRERARQAQQTLVRLTSEARRFSRERPSGLAVVSRDHLTKADLSALLDLDRVLTDLTDLAKRALMAHTCLIALAWDDGAKLFPRVIISDEPTPDNYFNENLADTVIGEALRGQEILSHDRLDDLPRGVRRHRVWGQRPRSLLVAPLLEKERHLGVIVADSPREAHFAKEEERFLGIMARQLVDVIARERLYRDIAAERAEFAAFYDVIKQLGSSLDLDTVSRVVLEAVQDIVSYDYGLLVNIEREAQQGVIEAVAGLPAEGWLDARFSLRDSLLGWVSDSKTYLHYPNVRDRSHGMERRRPIFSQQLQIKDLSSLLCLPLIRKNFVSGLLVFASRRPQAFSTYEIRILEVLAIQAAVSLENARVHAQMEQLATRDGLTGCYNHRYFQEWLDMELRRAARMPLVISLVMCDIDHFKKFNDTYGHPVGDRVLQAVAAIFQSGVRGTDLAARYGGEEFALVLLNSGKRDAVTFAERIREAVARMTIDFAGEQLSVTVSMGVATYPDDAADKAALIELADRALYFAKQAGRNRVVHAAEIDKA